MRLPIDHLLKLERAGVLRWVHPYSVTLEDRGPRASPGAVLFFHVSSGRTYTVRLAAYVGSDADLEYTGPKRPREHMLELIALVTQP